MLSSVNFIHTPEFLTFLLASLLQVVLPVLCREGLCSKCDRRERNKSECKSLRVDFSRSLSCLSLLVVAGQIILSHHDPKELDVAPGSQG